MLLLFTLCSGGGETIENQIALSPDMVINETGVGNASLLVDEQKSFGGSVSTQWDSKSIIFPVSAVIDLGAEYQISNLHFYDKSNQGKVDFSYGQPFAWKTLFTKDLSNKGWQSNPLTNIRTRYLQIKSVGPQKAFSLAEMPAEIILQGKLIGSLTTPIITTKPVLQPTMEYLIGTNAFIDDPIGILEMVNSIREYHVWADWNEQEKGKIMLNPSPQGWDFDKYYRTLKDAGIFVFPVVQQSPEWLTGSKRKANRPVAENADPLLPQSYAQHASFLFQYAARYGNGKVADKQLILASGQPRARNLNLLTHYENWNEQDKTWEGEKAYFTPYQYAAMSSADYDGHQGSMKGDFGIKNADPNAKLVMGGITDLNIDYVKALKFWSDHKRKGSFPWSAINFHHYSAEFGGKYLYDFKSGISPEQDTLKQKLEECVAYRNKYLPEVEVWLSEFGYDTNPTSKLRSPAIGSMSAEEVQACWLLRTYLVAAAAGIDRCFQFMIRDGDQGSSGDIFSSSGASYNTNINDEWIRARRPSWYYIHTMKTRLRGMRFEKEIPSGNADVLVYKFRHSFNQKLTTYVVWCKTSNDTKVANFKLKLTNEETSARLVVLEDKNNIGKESELTSQNQSVSLNVSEKPLFVIAGSGEAITQAKIAKEIKLLLNPSMIVNEGVDNATGLADEQSMIGDPATGFTATKPTKGWEPDYSKEYPLSAYFDLGKEYEVSKLFICDGTGIGKLTITTGKPGNWQIKAIDEMRGYKGWNVHLLNTRTRYIRLTREHKNVGVFEVAVYVMQ
ncbi:MAG: hypothetical protein H7Y04_03490 [Verrucomicrobia bacterium]|nr:hypothetical protein [Cytophagales bacterium]